MASCAFAGEYWQSGKFCNSHSCPQQCGWGSMRPHITGHSTCLPPQPGAWEMLAVGQFPHFLLSATEPGVRSQVLELDCMGWNPDTPQLVYACGHMLVHLGLSLLAHWSPMVSGRTECSSPLKALGSGPGKACFLGKNYHPPVHPLCWA